MAVTAGPLCRKTELDCRLSIAMPSKGLLNNPGENNCFLNCAVQVLWHLDVFRRSFRLFEGHACFQDSCIFCPLKKIFQQFQDSNQDALPPDVLRIAMAKAFQDQHRFQLGRMDDAAECFENILCRLHSHMAESEPEDMCNAKHCIPHQKFSVQILEQTTCKCGATSEPLPFFEAVHYVSASALIDVTFHSNRNGHKPLSFGELLRRTALQGEVRSCPEDKKCFYKDQKLPPTKIHKTLLNRPDIVSIGINWDTDRPTVDYVTDLLECVGETLVLKDMFDNTTDDIAKQTVFNLVGLVTYYGKHYTTFFYHSRDCKWIYFDDARVKEIGRDFKAVKLKCQRGRFQPLLIFFANPNGAPVDISSAPKTVTISDTKKEPITRQRTISESREHGRKIRRNDSTQAVAVNGGDAVTANAHAPKANGSDAVAPNAHAPRALKQPSAPRGQATETDGPPRAPKLDKKKSFKKRLGSAIKKVNLLPSVPGKKSFKATQVISNGNSNGHIEQLSPKSNVKPLRLVQSPTHEEEGSSQKERLQKKITSGSPESSPQSGLIAKHHEHLSNFRHYASDRQDSRLSEYDNMEYDSGAITRSNSGESDIIRENSTEELDEIDSLPEEARKEQFQSLLTEAESLLNQSYDMERSGNLSMALHLCTEANTCYRNASKLTGVGDEVKKYADNKRWESLKRSRLLGNKLSGGSESRITSSTSDYGSLSDASGSPIIPYGSELSPDQVEDLLFQQQARDQAKSHSGNPPRKESLPSLNNNDQDQGLPKQYPMDWEGPSIYATLPRRPKKSSTVSMPDNEIQALTSLLNDLNTQDNMPRALQRRISQGNRGVKHESERNLHRVYEFSQDQTGKALNAPSRSESGQLNTNHDTSTYSSSVYHISKTNRPPPYSSAPPPPTYDEAVRHKGGRHGPSFNHGRSGSSISLQHHVFTGLDRQPSKWSMNSDFGGCGHFCEQCGIKIVGNRRRYCSSCQSEYL